MEENPGIDRDDEKDTDLEILMENEKWMEFCRKTMKVDTANENDPQVVHEAVRQLPPGVFFPRDFPKTLPFEDLAKHQYIAIGSYIELQLEEATRFVVMAKVLENHNGLLLVSFGSTPETSEKRWVHMFSPFCHQFGWVGEQRHAASPEFAQTVSLIPGYNPEDLLEMYPNRVSKFVLRENVIQKHDFKEDEFLVLADPSMTSFYLAHVVPATENEDFYFHLKFGDQDVMNRPGIMPYQFYANHPQIFSYEMAKKAGINLKIPLQFHLNDDGNVMKVYGNVLVPYGRVRGGLIGPEITLQQEVLPMLNDKQKEEIYEAHRSLRYVEVLRRTSFGALQITAAEVVEFSDHLVRLKVSGVDSPVFMHMCDPNILHVGSCTDMGLAVDFDPKYFD